MTWGYDPFTEPKQTTFERACFWLYGAFVKCISIVVVLCVLALMAEGWR